MPLAARPQRLETDSRVQPQTMSASLIKDVIHLLRPSQWVKNGVVFAALIFAKHLFVVDQLLVVMGAFWCFCMVASGCYVMNDLRDCERDRQHP